MAKRRKLLVFLSLLELAQIPIKARVFNVSRTERRFSLFSLKYRLLLPQRGNYRLSGSRQTLTKITAVDLTIVVFSYCCHFFDQTIATKERAQQEQHSLLLRSISASDAIMFSTEGKCSGFDLFWGSQPCEKSASDRHEKLMLHCTSTEKAIAFYVACDLRP